MNDGHKVLFPAFLVVFASFLAFHAADVSFAGFGSFSGSEVSGLAILEGDVAECGDDATILYLYSSQNSHIAMIGSGTTTNICAKFSSGLAVDNPTRICEFDFSNLVMYVANGFSPDGATDPVDNAHVYAPVLGSTSLPTNAVPVCYDNAECDYVTNNDECSTLGGGYECLLSFYGSGGDVFNAHAAECGYYPNTLCCKSTVITAGPACGNGVAEEGEECDGADDSTCPGLCLADCSCGVEVECIKDDDCPSGQTCEDNVCFTPLSQPDACDLALADSGTTFLWGETQVDVGVEVTITLTVVNGDCDGETFSVQIHDVDDPEDTANIDPGSVVVSSGVGSTTWIAENNNPIPDPEDKKWSAVLQPVLKNIGNVLTVSGGACGDGNLNSGEQCDDGNNEDGDDCSAECKIEGIDGGVGSDSCTSFCVKFTNKCDNNDLLTCLDKDGDGCNEWVDPLSCGSEVCVTEAGSCVSPGCDIKNVDLVSPSAASCGAGDDWVCGSWGECVNGKMARSCFECSGNVCAANPLMTVSCSSEPPVKGPVFGMLSMLLAIIVLVMFYVL